MIDLTINKTGLEHNLRKAKENRIIIPTIAQMQHPETIPALPPLAPQGSPFRQAVWRLLLEIPYGTVTTYGALARTLRGQGISAAAQAVGGAVGHNPISILIPCHRVVGSDGSLTGYAGGVANKQFLLELEGVDMTGLYVPTRGTAL